MRIIATIKVFDTTAESGWGKSRSYDYAKVLSGDAPVFTAYGNDIFASDVVQQAIYCIITEIKKLKPRHIREHGLDVEPVSDYVQKVLTRPNPLMTKSEYLEKIVWQYELNYNAFIYVQRNNAGQVTALWPVCPVSVEFLENRGAVYVRMQFRNGETYALPYSSFIHLRNHYAANDLMGGDETGQPNNSALLETLKLNHILLQGVKKSLSSSYAINAIVKYNTLMDDGKMAAEIKKFEERLNNSQSGILPLDQKAEVIQFKRDLATVDANTLKFIDEKILRHFGVPLCILQGDFTTEQYNAFYQRSIEHIVVQLSESHTKGIFTDREQDFGNRIMFYPEALVFMNAQQTLEMVKTMTAAGYLYGNEARVAFGLEPLPELVGVRVQSLNYVDSSIAKEYQLDLMKNGNLKSTKSLVQEKADEDDTQKEEKGEQTE